MSKKPDYDLSKFFTLENLKELCQGDISLLPEFIVHDQEGWRGGAMVDSKYRVHIGDRDFLSVIATNWPVVNLGRVNATSIRYKLDLQPHHLEGGDMSRARHDRRKARKLTGQNPLTGKRPTDD